MTAVEDPGQTFICNVFHTGSQSRDQASDSTAYLDDRHFASSALHSACSLPLAVPRNAKGMPKEQKMLDDLILDIREIP